MRITHILKTPQIGGIEKTVENIIMQSKDIEFSAIFTKPLKNQQLVFLPPKKIKYLNSIFQISPFKPHLFYRWIRKYTSLLIYMIMLYRLKPHIVHTHTSDIYELIDQIRSSSLMKIDVIWTIHTEIRINQSLFSNLANCLQEFTKNSRKFVVTYVGSEPPLVKMLQSRKIEVTIYRISGGIHINKFHFQWINNKRKINLRKVFQNRDVNIGYIGRLSFEKGVDVLIHATLKIMDRYKTVKLFIIGDGPERKYLNSIVQNSQHKDRVFFLGFILDIKECMGLLDLYVQPSRSETFGISVVEAMAAGVPVIGSNVGGLPKLIKNMKTGLLFQCGNVESLQGAISKMIKSRKLRITVVTNAYKHVKKFDINKSVNAYYAIYNKMMSNASRH